MKPIFFIVFLLSLTKISAQIPQDSLSIWLRASNRVFTSAAFCDNPATDDGDDVFCWQDISQNGFRFRRIQDGTTKLKLNTLDTLNGMPSVLFDGTFGMVTIPPTDYFAVRSMTMFVVGSNLGTGIAISQPGTWNQSFRLNAELAMHHSQQGAWTARDHQLDWTGQSHLISTGTFGFDEDDLELHINGLKSSNGLIEDIIATDYLAVDRAAYLGQRGNNTSVRTGDIAEVIVYRERQLGDVQRIAVENYLSSKYDIPLIPESDFYSYDTEANGDYDCNVAGIGWDGTDSLEFNNSSSLNIQPSPGLDFTEEYYLFAGHRIEPNSISTDNLPVGYSERFGRVWAVEKTGAVDISILSFSFTALTDIEGTPDPNGTYALLYAQTVSPLSFAPLNTIATEVTDTGINFSLTNEQLQNGYYTLGAVDKIFNDPSSNTEPTSVKPANIYPNPATTTIAIPDIKARANYTITSINGQRSVSGQFTPGQRIDINLLPTGAYLIHLVTEDGEAISARFIKQ